MSALPGILGIDDTERVFASTVGQRVVFDAIQETLRMYNEEVNGLTSLFIERETEEYKARYLLAGGGKLQRLGLHAPPQPVKRTGKYDVAYPLRGWGAALGAAKVPLAYMSIAEVDAHLDTILIKNMNTLRWRILTSIFEDTNFTFTDPLHGNLTITRLANTDGTLYPPVLGSETEADDDHYSEAAYNVAAIADANNPVVTLRDEISEHFGGLDARGNEYVYLHGTDQTPYLEAITGFVPPSDFAVAIGANTADMRIIPEGIPGVIHGRLSGAFLSEYAWIPDTYGIMILASVPAPLRRRHDPADTGLPRGLSLVAVWEEHPLQDSYYENRYGLGCGNRLSAAVMEISGGGATYAPPTDYAE